MAYSKGLKRCGWLTDRGRCLVLVPDRKHTYCPKHQEIYERQGRSRRAEKRSSGFYSRVAWKKLRSSQLNLEPFCTLCDLPGDTVDHITPHQGNPDLFFDSSNLQTLCKRCHDAVTTLESRLKAQGKTSIEIGQIKRKQRKTNAIH